MESELQFFALDHVDSVPLLVGMGCNSLPLQSLLDHGCVLFLLLLIVLVVGHWDLRL